MAYSIIAEAAGEGAGSAATIDAASTVTAAVGDTIVAFVTVAGADLTASIGASDGTNSYSRKAAVFVAGSNVNLAILVAENVAAGTYTVSGNWGGSTRTSRGIKVVVLRGLKAASYQTGTALAVDQPSPGTATDAVTPGNMTPTEQPACVIGLAIAVGVQTPTAGTGFTGLAGCWQFGTGTNLGLAEHKRITSTGAVAATWTSTPTGYEHVSVSMILSETGAGGGAATLSAPTASNVTPNGATIGVTTDQASGTLYAVIDTAANLAGITAAQVKAGQKAGGSAALASGNVAVSTTTPSISSISGLSATTLYRAAIVQNNANGDSNVATVDFHTTGATGSLGQFDPTMRIQGWFH